MLKFFWAGNKKYKTKGTELSSDVEIRQNDDAFESQEVWQLSLDVLENNQWVYILAPVAWIELAEIDISVNDTTLTISGERKRPKEFYEYSMEIKNSECFWGKFLRNVILGENMDFSKIRAVMENNLLVIHVPKIRFDMQNITINKIDS